MNEFELEMRVRHPAEAAMWQAIQHTLKPAEASFSAFLEYFGPAPQGHELRPRRDGKRSPFHLAHFQWLPAGTPRRLDQALRETQEGPRGGSLQEQINELRARVEALERPSVQAIQAPLQTSVVPASAEAFCVFKRDDGLAIDYCVPPANDPNFLVGFPTKRQAIAEVRALNPRIVLPTE